jgi:hypothetical protein
MDRGPYHHLRFSGVHWRTEKKKCYIQRNVYVVECFAVWWSIRAAKDIQSSQLDNSALWNCVLLF